MKTIANLFSPQQAATAQDRLVVAYTSVFSGAGSKEDAEIVLSDLAAFTGFLNVSSPVMSEAQLRFAEGQRSVAARILALAGTSPAALHQLAHAVQAEVAARAQGTEE